MTFEAETNFTFIKEGDTGTNGTEYVCKIVPNIISGKIPPLYPMILNKKINYEIPQTGKWFRIQLWHNGERIFNEIESGLSDEGSEVKVKWSILKNKYSASVSDSSSLTVNETTGEFNFINYLSDSPANIIKCELTYKDLVYYATLPLITAYTNDVNNTIQLKDYTGFRYAIYSPDGRVPQYDNSNPFEIESNLDNINLNYTWNICGKIYKKVIEIKEDGSTELKWKWLLSNDLERQSNTSVELKNNQAIFKPSDEYYGE